MSRQKFGQTNNWKDILLAIWARSKKDHEYPVTNQISFTTKGLHIVKSWWDTKFFNNMPFLIDQSENIWNADHINNQEYYKGQILSLSVLRHTT
jgi:hypothetical protein